jgi:transcriptional antiterminator NusG
MESQSENGKQEKESARAWYVIHTYSGYENKVKTDLESKIHTAGMEDQIFNVVVPIEDDVEMKDGQRKVVKRKIFPGYVLVDMIVNPRSWYVVRNTTGVTGFVGPDNKEPIPLSEEEAQKILDSMGKEVVKETPTGLMIGDVVRIKSGSFENFTAKVSAIDNEKGRVTVLAEMFGGEETPVELGFDEVERA